MSDSHALFCREADAREKHQRERSARALHLLALANAAYVEEAMRVGRKSEAADLGTVSIGMLDVIDSGEDVPVEVAQEIEAELSK